MAVDEITMRETMGESRVTQKVRGLQKDDFLKLLLTELKYQDHESTMDFKDLMNQISLLTQVEQYMNMNNTFSSFQYAINSILFSSAINTIGKNVLVGGDKITIEGGEVKSLPAFYLDIPAQSVDIKIKNQGGIVVRKITLQNLSAGEHVVEWDGKNENGVKVGDGEYTFEVGVKSGENEFKPEKFIYGKVDGVNMKDGVVLVEIGNKNYEFGKILKVEERR